MQRCYETGIGASHHWGIMMAYNTSLGYIVIVASSGQRRHETIWSNLSHIGLVFSGLGNQ
jgi:hypothetical protein